MILQFLKKHFLTIIGAVTGAIAGYVYWQEIGCSSGSCAITSSPVNSTLYGLVLGALVFSMFQKQKKKSE